jgi:hypothetical protein
MAIYRAIPFIMVALKTIYYSDQIYFILWKISSITGTPSPVLTEVIQKKRVLVKLIVVLVLNKLPARIGT